jgi:purine nucleosidase
MDFDGCAVEAEHAVDALIRMVGERPGEITIVAIGPLTNIATATLRDPSFVARVKSLVVMGGSNNGRGNITPAAEFNMYVDPEAAKVVFDAGFAMTIVPWAPLTLRDAVFGRDQLDEIKRVGTPLSEFFLRVCWATLEYDERVGILGTTHPDSLSVCVALRPDIVSSAAAYHVDVETASPLTRGYTAMSWGVHGLRPNATVVERIDADRFYRLVHELLSRPITPSRPFTS